MSLSVKQDETPNPGDIRLLGTATVVTYPDRLAHAVEQLRGRTHVDDDGIVVGLSATGPTQGRDAGGDGPAGLSIFATSAARRMTPSVADLSEVGGRSKSGASTRSRTSTAAIPRREFGLRDPEASD
jgi:phage tail tape-measure protein